MSDGKVTLKEYFESRLAANEEARKLALDAIREAQEKEARHLRTWLVVIGIVVPIVLLIAKKAGVL